MSYICTSCQKLVESPGKFCPFCGQLNIEEEVGVSQGEKTKIFVVSFFFAPFGLYWFFKYFKSEDKEKKQMSNIALFITVGVLVFTIITTSIAYTQLTKTYQPVIEMYQDLGISY